MGLGRNGREIPRPSPQPGASRGWELGCVPLMSLSLFAPCDPAFLGLSASHPVSIRLSWMKRDLCFSLHVSLCTCPCPHAALCPPLCSSWCLSHFHLSLSLCLRRSPPISVPLIPSLTHHLPLSDVALCRKHCLSQSWWAAAPLPPTQVSLLLILLGLEEGWGRVSDLVLEQIRHFTRLGCTLVPTISAALRS